MAEEDTLAALRAFVALLEREQALLAEGQVEALPALIKEKSVLAARLDREPLALTDVARELVVRAGVLNETNGKLIALQLQRTQQALDVLATAARQAGTYGPDGQQQSGLGSRMLGKA